MAARAPSPIGELLQYWRHARHLSQIALAAQAEVSARHLCFVETGRARPSRQMVLVLASALEVPLRERNTLLLAAGFAPVYRESRLDAPELAPARAALQAILEKHEPLPSVVMDRHWNVLATNQGADRLFGWLLAEPPARPNVLKMMFNPTLLRPFVRDWESVAETLARRVYREAVGGIPDPETTVLLQELLALPGVPSRFGQPDPETQLLPVIPVTFEKEGRRFAFFSAVTTLGSPVDVTLQEIRIESFFPVDEPTKGEVAWLQEAHPRA